MSALHLMRQQHTHILLMNSGGKDTFVSLHFHLQLKKESGKQTLLPTPLTHIVRTWTCTLAGHNRL